MNDVLRNLNQQAQESLDGSPATARDAAGYVNIKFQCGPIQEHGVNGTSIENVIDLLVARLQGFQRGPFNCRENAAAIHCLLAAKAALESRTARREATGIEGTNVEIVLDEETAGQPVSGTYTLTNGETYYVGPNTEIPAPTGRRLL